MRNLLCLLLLFSCSHTTNVPVAKAPVIIPPLVIPQLNTPMPTNSVSLDMITDIAGNSSCSKYSWKNRGVPSKGYIKGMALAYAHEVCFPNKIVNGPLLDASKDALTYYGLKAGAINVYALLIGAGMRESSGRYCCGRDTSASNTSSSSAEAGMLQTSYNSHVASPELDAIFNDYKNNKHNCFEVFKEKVSCSKADLTNFGMGDGLKFQQMAKDCPAFSVAYAAITFKVLKSHYGPLIHKAAEYKQECVDMLTAVEIQVKAKPELCELLK